MSSSIGKPSPARSDMLDAERVKFEAHMVAEGYGTSRAGAGGVYLSQKMESDWRAWQFRAAQATPAGGTQAEIERLKAGWGEAFKLAIEWQGRALRAEKLQAERAPSGEAFVLPGEELPLARRATAGTTAALIAYADPQAFENFKQGTATKEWMWAKPDVGLVPVFAGNAAPTEPIWNPLDTPEFRERLDAYTGAMAKASLFDPGSVNASFDTRKNLVDFLEAWGAKFVASNTATAAPGDLPPLYAQALDLVHEAGYASVSMVQRRLRIGWNAARDLILLMADRSEIPDAWLPPAALLGRAAPSNPPVGAAQEKDK